jgi:lambda repressor-like predicted transcriptional regulator
VDRTELKERRRIYLKAVVHAAGLESMAALARELGVTQSTLTNVLSATRSASPELIRKIEQLAPKIENGSILGAQALPRGLDVDLAQPLNIGEQLKEAYRERLQEQQSSEERASRNIGEVVRNFESMGSDDVFIFISATQQPFEMNPNETKAGDPECHSPEFVLHLPASDERVSQAPRLLCRHRVGIREFQGGAFFECSSGRKKCIRRSSSSHSGRRCSLVRVARLQVGHFLQSQHRYRSQRARRRVICRRHRPE